MAGTLRIRVSATRRIRLALARRTCAAPRPSDGSLCAEWFAPCVPETRARRRRVPRRLYGVGGNGRGRAVPRADPGTPPGARGRALAERRSGSAQRIGGPERRRDRERIHL